ncbi:MAG: hypothetical protein M1822_008855 [Bathelium mastoideum]|nr:MAG: hypothetical protein M1822_008855 [Bathelium mastoideum]
MASGASGPVDQSLYNLTVIEQRYNDAYQPGSASQRAIVAEKLNVYEADKLLAWLRLPNPTNVLDLGCGLGTFVRRLRGQGAVHITHGRAMGLDISQDSLNLAIQLARDDGLIAGQPDQRTDCDPVAFLRADVCNIDAHTTQLLRAACPQGFDYIFAIRLIHHIPPTEHSRVLQQWQQLLAPNGKIIVWAKHEPDLPSHFFVGFTVRNSPTLPPEGRFVGGMPITTHDHASAHTEPLRNAIRASLLSSSQLRVRRESSGIGRIYREFTVHDLHQRLRYTAMDPNLSIPDDGLAWGAWQKEQQNQSGHFGPLPPYSLQLFEDDWRNHAEEMQSCWIRFFLAFAADQGLEVAHLTANPIYQWSGYPAAHGTIFELEKA